MTNNKKTTKSKFTKGELTYKEGIVFAGGKEILELTGDCTNDEHYANVDLFVNAKKMLDVCKFALKEIEAGSFCGKAEAKGRLRHVISEADKSTIFIDLT